MGTFHVSCEVGHHVHRARKAEVRKILVDTGSEYTWIGEEVLRKLGVASEKKDVRFIMANRQTISRDVGFAILRAGGQFTIDEVVFAREGDLQLLGARTLEGLNLHVDPRGKKLVAVGPVSAA